MDRVTTMIAAGRNALKAPREVAEGLRANFWLNRTDMVTILCLLVFVSQLLQMILPNEKAMHFGPITAAIAFVLGIIFSLVAYWFLVPFTDKCGYYLVGVPLTYARAREVLVASALPGLAPMAMLGLLGLGLVIRFVPMLHVIAWVGMICLCLYLVVQSMRLRKHLLDVSYPKAIFGPMILPFLLIVIGIVIGVMMVVSKHGQ